METRTQSTYLAIGIILNNSHLTKVMQQAGHLKYLLLRCCYNLHKCSQEVKAFTYISMVHPLMEYACIVWDPYQIMGTYINAYS